MQALSAPGVSWVRGAYRACLARLGEPQHKLAHTALPVLRRLPLRTFSAESFASARPKELEAGVHVQAQTRRHRRRLEEDPAAWLREGLKLIRELRLGASAYLHEICMGVSPAAQL